MSLGNISHTSNRIKLEREARHVRSQKRKGITNMYSSAQKTELQFKEFTNDELEIAKNNIRKRIKKEKKQLFIKTHIVSTIILAILAYCFFFWKIF